MEPSPVVDLTSISIDNPNENDLTTVGNQILKAFDTCGFVYLKNFGISHDKLENLVKAGQKFFDLDEETKLKYRRDLKTFHGFLNEQDHSLDLSVDNKKRARHEMYDIENLHKEFPKEVPELEETTKILKDQTVLITKNILQAFELALDAPRGIFTNGHRDVMEKDNFSHWRLIRYIPPSGGEQTIRFDPHHDFSVITFQMYTDLGGLQMMDKKGNWLPTIMKPGYIILFPGEAFQQWTTDRIKATKHHVTLPEDPEEQKKPRNAIIWFVHPDWETNLGPYDGSTKYPSMTGKDYAYQKIDRYFVPSLKKN